MASAGAALLAASGRFVHGGPGSRLGRLRSDTALLVAALDVLGLTFLLVGVCAFVSSWHLCPPARPIDVVERGLRVMARVKADNPIGAESFLPPKPTLPALRAAAASCRGCSLY